MARKQKWDILDMDNKLELVEAWCRDGATDKDIMQRLGISHDLFYKWKNEKPEFADTLKSGKEIVDAQVENALLKKALGYSYTEEKVVTMPDGSVKTEKVIKEVSPDTTAQIFWLKNRKPYEWRDAKNIELAGELNTKHEEKKHIVHEVINNPDVKDKIIESFRQKNAPED